MSKSFIEGDIVKSKCGGPEMHVWIFFMKGQKN